MAKQKTKDKIQTIMDRSGSKIAVNVDENYIFTTEDKVKILYEEYNSARKYSGDFLAYFGIFLTLIISLLTCDIKELPFIDAATIKAIFIIATILSLFFCIVVGIKWFVNKDKLKFAYFLKKLQGEKPNE